MSSVKKLADPRKNLTANGHFDQIRVIWSGSHTTKYSHKSPAVQKMSFFKFLGIFMDYQGQQRPRVF